MKNHPEHQLQIMINKFVRSHVPQPHFFFAIDRSKKTAEFSHVREKARGLVSGTPDTVLIVPNLPMIGVELKTPGNKPTEVQRHVGDAIKAAGHQWAWCNSVVGYGNILVDAGVPLRAYWEVAAAGHDATLASAAIKRDEAKTGTVSRKRSAPKPTAKQAKRLAAQRRLGVFA